MSCYEKLVLIRGTLLDKQNMPGKLGSTFRELVTLIRTIEWQKKSSDNVKSFILLQHGYSNMKMIF